MATTSLTPILSWLHVSDIHMGHGGSTHQWDQRSVLEALLEDARAVPGEIGIPQPALILVTGDLAFSGASRSPHEYSETAMWLDALRQTFHLERDRVFFIQGNHDVQRKVAETPAKQVWLEALRRNERLDVDGARNSAEIDAFLRERFANFTAFAQEYNSRCADVFSWSCDLVADSLGQIHQLPAEGNVRGFPLRLVGINTALLSQDNHDQAKLHIGRRTLAELDLKRSSEHALTLVLTHHPLSWLAPDDRERLAADIRGAHLHLCGHVHEADADQRRRGWEPEQSGLVTIVAGAAHGDHPEEIDGIRLPAGHGYNFGMIARTAEDLKLMIWPRIWADARRDFLPHSAVLPRTSLCQQFSFTPKMLQDLPPYPEARIAKPADAKLSFEDWHAYVPKRVFLASEEGFSRPLIGQFERHLQESERYFYKGDIAETTSIQFLKWIETERRPRETKFLLAMPRLEVMKRRDMAEGPTQAAGTRSPEEMVDEVFVTLFGLDLIRRRLRRGESIEVGFFSEEPYERTEILDKGLYLTYYRLGGQFGTTLYYYRDSLIYKALRGYFDLTLDASRYRISLTREKVRIDGIESPAHPTLDEFIREVDEQKRSLQHFEHGWAGRIARLRERIWRT